MCLHKVDSPFVEAAQVASYLQGSVGPTIAANVPDKIVNFSTSVSHAASSTHRVNATRNPPQKAQTLKGRSQIKVAELKKVLKIYHDKPIAENLEQGFLTGFRIGYTGPGPEGI